MLSANFALRRSIRDIHTNMARGRNSLEVAKKDLFDLLPQYPSCHDTILDSLDEDTVVSLIGDRDTIISTTEFDFDFELINTRTYRRAFETAKRAKDEQKQNSRRRDSHSSDSDADDLIEVFGRLPHTPRRVAYFSRHENASGDLIDLRSEPEVQELSAPSLSTPRPDLEDLQFHFDENEDVPNSTSQEADRDPYSISPCYFASNQLIPLSPFPQRPWRFPIAGKSEKLYTTIYAHTAIKEAPPGEYFLRELETLSRRASQYSLASQNVSGLADAEPGHESSLSLAPPIAAESPGPSQSDDFVGLAVRPHGGLSTNAVPDRISAQMETNISTDSQHSDGDHLERNPTSHGSGSDKPKLPKPLEVAIRRVIIPELVTLQRRNSAPYSCRRPRLGILELADINSDDEN